MQLTDQALGAVMMALQKSLMEQSDIVPVLQGFVFSETTDGLVVENPQFLDFGNATSDEEAECRSHIIIVANLAMNSFEISSRSMTEVFG